MISVAEPKLRPKKIRSRVGPWARERSRRATHLVRGNQLYEYSLIAFSLRVRRADVTGWQQDMACGRMIGYLLDERDVFCASFRTESGSGAEPAFFAATAWPSVLSMNPRYALVSVPWAASLWTVQVMM